MTYEDLQRVNTLLTPTDIGKGKGYIEVNQRIKAFRMLFPMGSITTELLSLEDGICIFKATVSDGEGRVLGTGTAYEKEGSSFINKTSFIENCETSAIGRALAMCGIGIDTGIASYEEVANAKEQQGLSQDEVLEEAKLKTKVLKYINNCKMDKEKIGKICELYKVKALNELNGEQCKHYIKVLEEKGIKIDE